MCAVLFQYLIFISNHFFFLHLDFFSFWLPPIPIKYFVWRNTLRPSIHYIPSDEYVIRFRGAFITWWIINDWFVLVLVGFLPRHQFACWSWLVVSWNHRQCLSWNCSRIYICHQPCRRLIYGRMQLVISDRR